jgi:hypothetical protein
MIDNRPPAKCSCHDVADYDGEHDVIALLKKGERYVFIYNAETRLQMIQHLVKFAKNPELSLTWREAAAITEKIREDARREHEQKERELNG